MEKQVRNLRSQVLASVAKGAKILYGNLDYQIKDSNLKNGFYFHPIVMENITKEQPAYCEELFGPVFSLFRFHDPIEAAELANCTDYGLSASIFTTDEAKMTREALALEAGNIFINDIVVSDPAIPCGGVKDSGFGRECYKDGLHETLNKKAIIFGK